MRLKILSLTALLLFALKITAQTTAISATVVDSDSQAWNNGSWRIVFQPNQAVDPNPADYNINGTPLSPSVTSQSGMLSTSAVLSLSVYQSTAISPAGSSWNLTICPLAVTACGILNFQAIGSSINLSSTITSTIVAPRFRAVANTYGYSDIEAQIQLNPGSNYFNVTLLAQRCWNGSAWGNCYSGGITAIPVPLNEGGTAATTSQGAATNIVDGSKINPLAVSIPDLIIDCAQYSTLALCADAVQTYVTTNETGLGHAIRVLLHDQDYPTSGTAFPVYSGMQIIGIQPRLAANGSTIWQSPTPNGGTWLDCGGSGSGMTGGNTSGLTGVVISNIGFKNCPNAMTFGGNGVNGLSNSIISQVYDVGPATCCSADTELINYNANFLQVFGLYGYNVNTCFDFEDLNAVGLYSGNSNIYDPYCYTYPKSVANGNSTEPGMLLGPVTNLISVYRPQVFTPFGGDDTGIGLELNHTSANSIYAADMEGDLGKAVYLTGDASGNSVELNIGSNVADADWFVIDSGSFPNRLSSANLNAGWTFNGTANGQNLYIGDDFFTWGNNSISNGGTIFGQSIVIGNGTRNDASGNLGVQNIELDNNGSGTGIMYSGGNFNLQAQNNILFACCGNNSELELKTDVDSSQPSLEPINNAGVDIGGQGSSVRNIYIGNHLNQDPLGSGFAGQCYMSTSTTCTFSLKQAYAVTPLCFAVPVIAYAGGSPACYVSGTTVTITAPASNSQGWNAFVIGQPY